MRIALLGNAGSGKSTLAGQLADRYRIPVLDLDTLVWEPGQIAVPRDAGLVRGDVLRYCQGHADWIIEGCYADLVAIVLVHQPELLLLDPGEAACLQHCRARPWEPHKYASRAEQDAKLDFLLAWVRDYYVRDGDMSLAGHLALYRAYSGPKRHITMADNQNLFA
ncbi:P-loop NTPase family protein [Chitinimonas naiadis]